MIKGRRVGTLTCGVTLILFGALFLLRQAVPTLDFRFILSLWPLVLILLGIETVVAYAISREDKVHFDGGAVAIFVLLLLFAMAMGGAEFIMENVERWTLYHI